MFLGTSPPFQAMQSSEVFCFLWDDPLFNPNAESAKRYLEDPEFLTIRREERLLALEILYIKMSALEKSAQQWKETASRHFWVLRQLLDRVDIPRDLIEDINIEQQVNLMD